MPVGATLQQSRVDDRPIVQTCVDIHHAHEAERLVPSPAEARQRLELHLAVASLTQHILDIAVRVHQRL
jgi:hypothetical protein